jgi:hypothetical protein
MRDVDRDPPLTLLGRLVDVREIRRLQMCEGSCSANTFVIAAVNVVFP